MTQGRIKILVVGFILCILLTSCKPTTPIKIGIVGTMSGAESDLSVSGRRGAELAVEEINQAGGINGNLLELVVKDDENNPEIALKVDQEFLDEGVNLIIGHYTSGMVLSVIDYINSVDALMLGPTISADQLSQKDDHFIRFIASTKEQAEAICVDIEEKQLKKVMVIYDLRNKGFTEKLVDNFSTLVFKNTGFKVKVLPFDPNEPISRQETLDSIGNYKPDGLFIVASAETCATISQNLIENTQLYGPLWANTQEILRKGGAFVEEMILVGAIDSNSEVDRYRQFSIRFYEKYGEQPTFASVYTYDTMMALKTAIEETHSVKPSAIKAKITEISKFSGIQEDVIIDQYGDTHRKYGLFQIKSGKLQKVE